MPLAQGIANVKLVAAVPSGDIQVFAQFDKALFPHDHEAPVSPTGEPIGREPIDPQITHRTVRARERHIAIIVDAGIILVEAVGRARHIDARVLHARVKQELLNLVAADVDQNAAGFRTVEEPIRPGRNRPQPVRTQA